MADESVYRIEIPVVVEDKTSPAITQAQQKITSFEQAAKRTEQQLNRMNAAKFQLALHVADKASAVITMVSTAAGYLTGKTVSLTIKAVDLTTSSIRSAYDGITSLKRAVTTLLTGDMTKELIIKPVQMAADMEELGIPFESMLGSAAKANKADSFNGLLSVIKKTFDLYVVTAWGDGIRESVQPRLKKLVELLSDNDGAVKQWSSTLKSAGKAAADFVMQIAENVGVKLKGIVDDPAWQQLDAVGKIQMAWDQIIWQPLKNWWDEKGEKQFVELAGKAGGVFAEAITVAMKEGIKGLFNSVGNVIKGGENGQGRKSSDWIGSAVTGGLAVVGLKKGVGLYKGTKNGLGKLRKVFGDGSTVTEAVETAEITGVGKTAGTNKSTHVKNADVAAAVEKADAGGAKLSFGKKLFKAGRKTLGKVMAPLDLAEDAYDIITAKTATDRAGAIGRTAGGMGGAVVGAMIGQALIPIPGVGAGIGSFVGKLAGSTFGEWLGRKMVPQEENTTTTEQSSGQNVQVNVSYNPAYTINAVANADDVLQIIRDNQQTIADELADEIGTSLGVVFNNMPIQKTADSGILV